jgi:hypothetical protein
MAEVDLVVNCFERTYRDVLTPGFFPRLAAQNRHRFARRTAIVNNVVDRAAAQASADTVIDAGELDTVYFVEDRLDKALERTGLTRADLGRIPYFSDFALVAVTLEGPDWILHCDAEVELRAPADWIVRSLELMARDARVLVANPTWTAPTLERETIEWTDEFALGLGFSDQLFLARRSELARPIYGERCAARLRYPMAHVGHIFEARVDAYMRHHHRLRATYLGATYVHPENMGVSYPALTLGEKLRFARNLAVVRAIRAAPWKPRCVRHL